MTNALLPISTTSLRAAPFFVIEGPEARRLTCQWTCFSQGRARGMEFEILCPETPEAMGCLFGLHDAANDEFSMRPAVRMEGSAWRSAPELDLDASWRGDLGCVLDSGHDLDMGPDGRLVIVAAAPTA